MEFLIIAIAGLFWYFYFQIMRDSRVSMKEIRAVKTEMDLIKLQKKIKEKGMQPFPYFPMLDTEISIIQTCSWCGGRGIYEDEYGFDKSCTKCLGKRNRPGLGTEIGFAKINPQGDVFIKVGNNFRKIA